MSYKILIVDDEAANVRMLERLFRRTYTVITATSGIEAIELLALHDVALIISDQRMPGMTGIEFLKRAADMRQQTVRIILTGYTDAATLVEAINSGVIYKYVTKPWVNEDLQQTVERGLQHYDAIKSQHNLRLEVARLHGRLKSTRESFVRVVAEALNQKDPYSHGHALRTGSYACAIGEALGLDSDEMEPLSLAAFLHEAALMGVPNEILRKDSMLTFNETQILSENTKRGLDLLAGVPDFEGLVGVIGGLEEHYDGGGHPLGLGDEQIPLYARIIAVANAYDEMVSPRSSMDGFDHAEAVERLKQDAGTRFDPKVVEAFCESTGAEHACGIPMGGANYYELISQHSQAI
ncbi:MAG: response regulator [Saprospiraceae bacterium]|nr:response regulator [Pyrinomonadaceae bacterium]